MQASKRASFAVVESMLGSIRVPHLAGHFSKRVAANAKHIVDRHHAALGLLHHRQAVDGCHAALQLLQLLRVHKVHLVQNQTICIRDLRAGLVLFPGLLLLIEVLRDMAGVYNGADAVHADSLLQRGLQEEGGDDWGGIGDACRHAMRPSAEAQLSGWSSIVSELATTSF